MSEIRVENIVGETGTDAVKFTKGINVTGVTTATSFSGSGANLTSLPAGNLTGALPAISGANLTGVGAGKLLKIHDAVTTTSTLVTTPSRGDTTLAITFTPQALGSTFFIVAYQFGRNGVSSDSSFHRFFLMREIAGGTASELQSYIYLGSTDHSADYDIYPLTYKDSPTYTAGQTINYHIEVGFYTGNYSLNFRAQTSNHPSRIFVYEMGA